MARPLRIEYPGAYYHITARGNERKAIFQNNADRKGFLSYLKSAYLRYGATIHVYCLMHNHYHLLLETPKGNLSKIMHHINSAYTAFYNTKYKRAGHLFQGRYKAILIEADSYAGELSRYIHLNPVRAGMTASPEKYIWSSYQYYLGKKKRPDWLKIDFILGYFEHNKRSVQECYADFVLAKRFDGNDNPLKKTVASTMLGGDSFVDKIIDTYIGDRKKDRELPALNVLKKRMRIDVIYREVKSHLGENNSVSRKAVIYLCHQHSGHSLKNIGYHFGISESGVSLASSRFKKMIQKNRKIRKTIDLIIQKLIL